MATNPRTYVHYLSGHPVSGGIAWLGVLCAGDFQATATDWGGGYGLTQVFGTYPLQLWDQDASAHEMGHNVGSEHTHCYSPPIDHCYNGEAGCYSGPVENPGAGNGTIMSYCHLLGWQYMSLVFHPRCISEQMMPEHQRRVLPDDPGRLRRRPAVGSLLLTTSTRSTTTASRAAAARNPLLYCPRTPSPADRWPSSS